MKYFIHCYYLLPPLGLVHQSAFFPLTFLDPYVYTHTTVSVITDDALPTQHSYTRTVVITKLAQLFSHTTIALLLLLT